MLRRLLLLLLLLPAPALAHVNLAEAPIGRLDLPWWRARWEWSLQEKQADPHARIIWLGDSITQNWQRQGGHGYDDCLPVWQHYYAPYQALDFGFKGDTTASLIWRLDHGQVAGLHPRLAIILIGANNFGHPHWDAAMTVPGIQSVVRLTAKNLPGTHIVLLGVLPSIRSAWVDAQTRATNAALARIYTGNANVTFVNLSALFLRDGKADPGLFIDRRLTPPDPPLHPTPEGMTLIAQALAPLVREYAGP